MPIKIETDTSAILTRLTQDGYSDSTIASHRRCYDSLQAHFSCTGPAFTMNAAIEWLEERKSGWSYATYCEYRSVLFRLERYLLSGDISRTVCWSVDDFACRDATLTLPAQLRGILDEFRDVLAAKFCETSVYNYSQGCKDFMIFIHGKEF